MKTDKLKRILRHVVLGISLMACLPAAAEEKPKTMTLQELLEKVIVPKSDAGTSFVYSENSTTVSIPLSGLVNALIEAGSKDKFGPADLLRALNSGSSGGETPYLEFLEQEQGGWTGGGGYECVNSEKLLKSATKYLGQGIRRMSPSLFSEMKGLTQLELAKVIERMRFEPDKRVRRDGQSLMFNYGRDENGAFVEALNPFCVSYSSQDMDFFRGGAPEDQPVYLGLLRKILHEASHLVGIGNSASTNDDSDTFADSVLNALNNDYVSCELKNSEDYEKIAWLGWKQIVEGRSWNNNLFMGFFKISVSPLENRFALLVNRVSGVNSKAFGEHFLLIEDRYNNGCCSGENKEPQKATYDFHSYLTKSIDEIAQRIETGNFGLGEKVFPQDRMHLHKNYFGDVRTERPELIYIVNPAKRLTSSLESEEQTEFYKDQNKYKFDLTGSFVEMIILQENGKNIHGTYRYQLDEAQVDVPLTCKNIHPRIKFQFD